MSRRTRVYVALLIALALAPVICAWLDRPFYLDLLTRALILAIAASGLNLILGGGGMVSLGHAAYIGIGAYCVGIGAHYGLHNGWAHLGLALAIGALFALATGAISLRAKGVHFIMITLAFSQMAYFALISLDEYGADDGLLIDARSQFRGALDMQNDATLYYWSLALLTAIIFLTQRLMRSRFGRVIVACKFNEPRMQSLGINTRAHRLACYALSAIICALAGVLLGNFTEFVSPAMMHWTRSAELVFMVIIGGAGAAFGGLLGALSFVLLEEFLSTFGVYWHFLFGLVLIALVLFGAGGLHGLLGLLDKSRDDDGGSDSNSDCVSDGDGNSASESKSKITSTDASTNVNASASASANENTNDNANANVNATAINNDQSNKPTQ